MATRVRATYDGRVLRPDEPLDLAPDTRVTIVVEESNGAPISFLKAARSLRLQGPPDWSERLEDYLYDPEKREND